MSEYNECDICGKEVDPDSDLFDCTESMCPYSVFNYDVNHELDFSQDRLTVYIPDLNLDQDTEDILGDI